MANYLLATCFLTFCHNPYSLLKIQKFNLFFILVSLLLKPGTRRPAAGTRLVFRNHFHADVGMCVCVCVRVCVCACVPRVCMCVYAPRLLKTIHLK